ncbi:DELTA-actitoxin-Afr1a-like [Megalops cyprinoides]|uniref:DELTA-actitoxin-Afr1a-like n=1 Tax=Megalops cyprinoides TaxID=118141 RepID=UPI001864637D|nr:DELTA-actitoxin-Afr1a-like [Megalops cyprinoides]
MKWYPGGEWHHPTMSKQAEHILSQCKQSHRDQRHQDSAHLSQTQELTPHRYFQHNRGNLKASGAAELASAIISGLALTRDIVHDSVAAAGRSVVIYLTNRSQTYILTSPQVYTYSGYCSDPPQPTVTQGETEICSFRKTAGTACGTVGLLTYDITNDQRKTVERLAIMFSVPFDYTYYDNWLALGLFEADYKCNELLYKQMYYDEGTFKREKATGAEILYTNKDKKYTVRGTMSPAAKSILKVEFWDEI